MAARQASKRCRCRTSCGRRRTATGRCWRRSGIVKSFGGIQAVQGVDIAVATARCMR